MAETPTNTWRYSGRDLLAATAGLNLVARLPEDIVVPTISIVAEFVADPMVGFVTTWLMFAVALYTFAPLGYSYLDVLPRWQPAFRTIFASGAVGLGIALQQVDDLGILLVAVLLTPPITTGLFLAYFRSRHGWTLLDPQGRAIEILEFITPHEDAAVEIESDLAYEGWLYYVGAGSYLLAIGMVLGIPVVLAAIVTRVLFFASPVPDIVFLGWALSTRVAPYVSVGPDHTHVQALELDLEKILIDTIENVTRSAQGMFMMFFVVLGLFLSAGYLFIGIRITSGVIEVFAVGIGALFDTPSIETVRLLWNMLGFVLLPVFAGCYGIWAWVRELRRLPHFLDVWEARDTRSETERIARPPGLVAMAVVAWVVLLPYVHYDGQLLEVVFAVLWPLAIAGGLWTVRWTYYRPAQQVTFDPWLIVVGLLVQLWSIWIATDLQTIVDAFGSSQSLFVVLAVPLTVSVLLTLTALIPVIERYERQYDDARSYLLVLFLFALGLFALLSRPMIPPSLEILWVAFTIVPWGFGLLLGLVRYYDL